MYLFKHLYISEYTEMSGNPNMSDYPWWNDANAYSVGNRVYNDTYKKDYVAVVPITAGSGWVPGAASGAGRWEEIGFANFWKPFDNLAHSAAQPMSGDDIYYLLTPSRQVDTVALFGLVGTTVQLRLQRISDGGLDWSETRNIPNPLQPDGYGYGFAPGEWPTSMRDMFSANMLFTGVPYVQGVHRIRVIVSAHESLDYSAVGIIGIGHAFWIGDTLEGTESTFVDFSSKTTDEFGYTTIVRRGSSFNTDYQIAIENARIPAVNKVVAGHRGIFVIVYPSYVEGETELTRIHDRVSLMNFGFISDYNTAFQTSDYTYATLSIEGVI